MSGGALRKTIFLAIVTLVIAAFVVVVSHKSTYRLTLHAYFGHVQNVKKRMPVCVDGVQFGSVADVIVRPELGERPVDVVLSIYTSYPLRLPQDVTAQVVEPGVLRPTVIDIDTRGAGARSVEDGGSLLGRESGDDQAAHALGVVVKALADQSKANENSQSQPSAGNNRVKNP
jgi:ABC-type transporter Mla subunit MlaD